MTQTTNPDIGERDSAPPTPLPFRLLAAAAMGVVGYALVLSGLRATPMLLAKDFTWAWRAARALLLGHDPYQLIQATGPFPFSAPFFYPLPAAVVALPVAPLPPDRAGALFFGASCSLLAFALTRDRLWRLLAFVSAPFFMAAANVQWSPLIVAAALTPNLQWLAVTKPNLGLASFFYRPTWRGALGGAAFLLLCVPILPRWPIEWLATLGQTPQHAPPVLRFGGVLLLLALLRWRTSEGRLLTAMACVPQVMYFYDQLPLWMIPRSWRSMLFLSAASWGAWSWWWAVRPRTGNGLAAAEPFLLGLVYLPALLIVLRAKDRGTLPHALRRVRDWWSRRRRSSAWQRESPRETPPSACRSVGTP